jgi:hypothetical protein
VREAVRRHAKYIASQTLATSVSIVPELDPDERKEIDVNEQEVKLSVKKAS